MSTILVTGALGNVGSRVLARLLAAGADVRGADLDPSRIDPVGVRFDFTDPTSWSAFAGCDSMFLVRPPALSNIARDMLPALETAKHAGIEHIVLLSLQGAEHNKVVPHAKIEAWLRESGIAWTMVRPSFFMENLSTTHASDIRDRDCLMVPAGKGATSFVAADDVAAVATAALLDPQHYRNTAWTPTGPQALTYAEVTAILTEVLGRPIQYGRPGLIRYLRHATGTMGMPLPMALVTCAIYTVARLGKAAGLTEDVAIVTGRPPVTFTDWARGSKEVWQ